MKNTGERFLPDFPGDWTPEHMHRYALAAMLCAGADVLDVASGEGYGSAMLADTARSVVGVDIAEETVVHARNKYTKANLEYRQGSATNLVAAGLEDASFDVVVSFETIEHLYDHSSMIDELCRVLRPDGVLLISSPDKLEYTDVPGYHNEYHVHELYRNEFEALLASRFRHAHVYGQRLEYASLIFAEEAAPCISFSQEGQPTAYKEHLSHAVYNLILASNRPVPLLPHSVWKHRLESSEYVRSLNHKLEWMEPRLADLEKQVLEQAEQIQNQNVQICALKELTDTQLFHLHAITQSRSWKLTHPLRMAASLLRKLKIR